MRKLLTAGAVAVAMSGALVAGAAPASAAAPAPAAPAAAVASQRPAMAPPGFEYLTWYWTETNCENNGARLQVRGTIRDYYCEQSPYLTYYLWVKY